MTDSEKLKFMKDQLIYLQIQIDNLNFQLNQLSINSEKELQKILNNKRVKA